jgi:hypothetical protein
MDAKSVEIETCLLELIIFWIEYAIVDNIEYFLNKFWWNWWNYSLEYSKKFQKGLQKGPLGCWLWLLLAYVYPILLIFLNGTYWHNHLLNILILQTYVWPSTVSWSWMFICRVWGYNIVKSLYYSFNLYFCHNKVWIFFIHPCKKDM